ncbi:MAG: RNA-binding protein [Rhizobiaceae bacterium]|nr:RNA-binding protein [Rhizobiaceae bacterium]
MPVGNDPEGDDDWLEGAVNSRMCIVSRRTMEADALIRFVAAPDGSVVPDLRRRLPGRGAHVEARRETVETAVKRKLFRRALKTEVTGTDTLAADVDDVLRRAALGFLGLARKSGQLVTGATKVDLAIRSGRAVAVLHASDAAADGIRKLEGARKAAVATGAAEDMPVFRPFTADEMGLAFGGGNVIHAAVLAGDAGAALLKRLLALSNYRGDGPTGVEGAADGQRRPESPETNEEHPARAAPGTEVGCGVDPAQEAEA